MFQGLSVIDQIGIIEVGDHCVRNDLPHRRRDDPETPTGQWNIDNVAD